MTKKIFLSTLFLCLGLISKAEDTDVSQYENIVFPVSTIGEAGTTVTVSVEMNNTVQVTGFQFDIYLPNGITIPTVQTDDVDKYLIELSGTRSKSSHSLDCSLQDDGAIRVLCTSFPPSAFSGTSGVVCTIELNIGEDVTDGDYPVIFKNIIISDAQAQKYKVEQVETTLTVGAVNVNYDEGYAVKVMPFAVTEDVEVPFLMNNAVAIADMSFDVVMPSELASDEICYADKFFVKTKFTTESEVVDGTIHVTVEHKGSNKVSEGEKNEIAVLGLVWNDDIPAGAYPITIKNIKLTDTGGNTYRAAPYTTEIFVGENPKIAVTDGVVAFHGNYGETEGFELLKASLPEGATIDLTEVSDMAEDPSELRTDNVIVTTEAISYGRAMSNEWGSLCLPFTVESNENIQLYELKSASSSAMTFDPVSSVEANTPVIFKASGDGFTVKAANDGFDTGFAAAMPKTSIEAITDWVLNGSYSEETIDVSGMQAYGLMNNEFHRFTKTLTAGAFRAWLQNNGAPMNATIRIEESTDGISIIEQEDGSVKLIFDMQGRQLNDCPSHQILIENGHKVVRTK